MDPLWQYADTRAPRLTRAPLDRRHRDQLMRDDWQRVRLGLASAGGVIYVILCLVLLNDWMRVPTNLVPTWLIPLALTTAGPAAFLVFGLDAWAWFIGSITVIGSCLGIAYGLYRARPESEGFVVALLAAVVVWAASGWLMLAFGL